MIGVKVFPCLAVFVVCLLLPACSAPPSRAVLRPVGPTPAAPINPDIDGYLVVYSAWSHFVDQGSTAHHSRYTITAENGKMTREVINHIDRFDEGPIHLPLPPGTYHVSARSAHFGRVIVPVVIQSRQTTFVYLDGSSPAIPASGQQPSEVKLPDGEVVGWSATSVSPHSE